MLLCLFLSSRFATSLSGTEPPINDVAFASDGTSFVAVSQSGLHVFDWPTLKKRRTINTSALNLHCVEFSPDSEHVVVGGGDPSEVGIAEVFSWPSGDSIKRFTEHDDSVRSVAWIDDARFVTASIDREIRLYDLDRATSTLAIVGHSRSVDSVCLLADGKTLVSAGADQSVRVWDLTTANLVRSMNQHTGPVHALALRPVAEGLPMIASAAGDLTIRLWQPTIGRMVRYVRLDAEPLDIAWLRDGSSIVASCSDGKIRVVDPDEVTVTRVLAGVDGWAYTVAVAPSGDSILVGGSNGQFRRVAR